MSSIQYDAMDDAIERIRREIARQGWTQKDLALQANVSQTMISHWLTGKVRNPRYDNLVAVAFVLNLSVRLTLTRGAAYERRK